ncbi:hypothetical protein IQ07DRAFT_640667 [Pyrenochaeta sp. DS3sAY3a]|nr:hypothetical protein IQ07DRAFT_640667 [Pyrenochaeta sp. DS3sAY3a]
MVQPLQMPLFAPDPAIPWHIYKRASFFSQGWSISASRVLTHFQASLEGEYSGEDDDLAVQLAEGEYLDIKRYFEAGHGHVNDYRLMYDYVEHDRTLTFRKPLELCQWIVDDFITTIKVKAEERSGVSPNFAHFTEGLVQLPYMKVPIGRIGTYSPMGTFGPLTGSFLTVPLPTVVVEAFNSQSIMSPAKRAKDYLNGTNGRIRVVICITVDGGRQAGKEATFSVWRMERKNGAWTVVNSVETIFRDREGKAVEGVRLTLWLSECAAKHISRQMLGDEDTPITIKGEELWTLRKYAHRMKERDKDDGDKNLEE